jgi:ParB-like chromosome segregation protein Spo0J
MPKPENIVEAVRAAVAASHDPAALIARLREILHEASPQRASPVDYVRWVPIAKVRANEYNPNSVAKNEMRLLHTSISHDGFTQPVVVVFDAATDSYVIVDGFHRFSTLKLNEDIQKLTGGMVPVVVIDKPINDRMASTIRHNRARGKHSVAGMASMVFEMLDNGWKDAAICAELGLEVDELVRLKHVTGFSKLFENTEYQRAWETRRQMQIRKEYDHGNAPQKHQ